ncbi:hypothetical protein BDV37DRAFT_244299 [Aspergillus pseudonomiae]|uniref:Uncharacterized protein n=1 Tax=Aspergillus pseudonomiae TaxID=1506151 RepID=A0A5N7DHH9_9EURO|nr:uncharacterized protein BDV37DRAFT_244299 [Aspergillus pseudonomiae]KAE8405906.1 hypothetical protein BDV37DRAFT_244299 [Aspergillus pseudonomiae]
MRPGRDAVVVSIVSGIFCLSDNAFDLFLSVFYFQFLFLIFFFPAQKPAEDHCCVQSSSWYFGYNPGLTDEQGYCSTVRLQYFLFFLAPATGKISQSSMRTILHP